VAAEFLARYGPNELPPPRRDPLMLRVGRQLAEPMALLLLIAAAVSALALGERLDGVAIVVIVVLNAAIGLLEEGRAVKALEALRRMEAPTATVVRGGAVWRVAARELVPGDLVVLAAGDRVPADLLVEEAAALEVDESMLTGESLPVAKRVMPRRSSGSAAGIGTQSGGTAATQLETADGSLLSGTLITRGTARGTVTATGAGTRLGRIAASLHRRSPVTPLQRELARLTSRLGTIAVGIAAAVFVLMLVRTGVSGNGLEQSFLAAVALAVAAVPEGLATVVAVGLALGVRRMAREGAIVRRLPAVETLGSTTVIATDKTGTLTHNRLRVELVMLPGFAPTDLAGPATDARARIAEVAVGCNDATVDPPAGDPVDLALLEAFQEATHPGDLPRIAAIPFDAERRRMTTLNRASDRVTLLVKGARKSFSSAARTRRAPTVSSAPSTRADASTARAGGGPRRQGGSGARARPARPSVHPLGAERPGGARAGPDADRAGGPARPRPDRGCRCRRRGAASGNPGRDGNRRPSRDRQRDRRSGWPAGRPRQPDGFDWRGSAPKRAPRRSGQHRGVRAGRS
jgi:Ca2+-transporting ATPase